MQLMIRLERCDRKRAKTYVQKNEKENVQKNQETTSLHELWNARASLARGLKESLQRENTSGNEKGGNFREVGQVPASGKIGTRRGVIGRDEAFLQWGGREFS